MFPKPLVFLLAPAILLPAAVKIEQRDVALWPTGNTLRFRHPDSTPKGRPVWVDTELPAKFNPDSLRILPDSSTISIPAKVEWRAPKARISWLSTGAAVYTVYFDLGNGGETRRAPEPAMIGTGDRVTYGRLGVRGKLAVGLWGHPVALDFDYDGNTDVIVSCPDRPYNGTYLFRNIGTNAKPLFDRAEWLGRGHKDMVGADFNGDGEIDLVVSGGYYSAVRKNGMSGFVPVKLPRSYHVGRDDLWYPVDWDRDGRIDILAGVSDWRDYGWDDAYNGRGEWTRGPLHGYVWFHRNTGTNEKPEYAEPVMLQAGGKPIDQYGSPAPNPVDWFGRGRLDLIAGEFIDQVTLFRNTGGALAAGTKISAGGKPLKMDLCMIQPRVVSWHPDGRPSLLIAEEDGTVSLVENLAPKGQEPRLAAPKPLEQMDPYMKSGALSRPVAVDWNGDGLLDLVAGNSAGYIQYFENVGSRQQAAFENRGYLKAGGQVIRKMAGPNGSIQGPAETKWGYTNPWVADWDLDGKPDLIVNDIWGAVVWYRNIGAKQKPELAPAQPIEVEWAGRPPKPEWVWWEPKGKQLVTQWRTTPRVVDWDGDGLPDLVMLDHQGYLSLFRRTRQAGVLKLLPPEHIFVEAGGRFLNLSAGRAGRSGRRKVDLVDWDGDGDLDLITDSDAGPIWYENTGTQAKPVMSPRGQILKARLSGHNPTPIAADWNGDGRLDLLVGAEDGFFYFFERSYIEAQR
ncbi:MAG TPA: VCBS repeat-containing protein [Bryobacteraceae bacterium]|nr:VCBS repeat-containing protein [Bryobacteraceae bacterium]